MQNLIKIVVLLCVVCVGGFGYKYYKVDSYIDKEIVSQATARGVVVDYKVMIPWPLSGATIYGINVATLEVPKSPMVSVDKWVLTDYRDNSDVSEARLKMEGLNLATNAIPQEAAEIYGEMFASLQDSTPVLSYLAAPHIFYLTDMFSRYTSESPEAKAKYGTYIIEDADMHYKYLKSNGELEINITQYVPNHNYVEFGFKTRFDKSSMRSLSVSSATAAITVVDGYIIYQDDGFYDLYRQYLKSHVVPEEQDLDQWLLSEFEKELAAEEIDLWPDIKSSVSNFLTDPSGIKVSLNPEKPFVVRNFKHYKYWDIPAVLNSYFKALPKYGSDN